MSPPKDHRLTVPQSFVSGGVAAVIARTLTSPFDVVKILAQVGTKDSKEGFLRTFSSVYANEGIRAFWKGNGIACVRLFPYNAIQFASFVNIKVAYTDPFTGTITPFHAAFAGAMSGVIAVCTTYPLDMVKTRLTVAHTDLSKSKYKGMVHAFKTIYKEEGFRAFSKGLTPTLLGVIPFSGGTFMAYSVLHDYRMFHSDKEDPVSPMETFIDGCLAGAFAQTFSFPFDTIRKKLQAQSANVTEAMKPDIQFSGMIDGFVQTVRLHGFKGLWRGSTANLIKVVPYAGFMFLTYEVLRKMFLYQNGYTTSLFHDIPKPGVDQTMRPHDLQKLYEARTKSLLKEK